MTIKFNLNLELTLNDISIEGIESKHEHLCDKDRREHKDSDLVNKITGSAALTGGMDLSFDMSEEEMKGSYQMIQELGRTFAGKGQKVVERAQEFVNKFNDSSEDERQHAESERESAIITKNEEFKRLLERYNSKPGKAAFEKANVFGRRLEGDIESYLNDTDSPLAEIEEIYESLCSKRREMRQAEAARS